MPGDPNDVNQHPVRPKYSSVSSTLVRRLTRHFGSLQKNRLIALERAAAADAEYEFADGSSSPANAIIVGVGVGPDAAGC